MTSVPAAGGDETDYRTSRGNGSGKSAEFEQKLLHLPGNPMLLLSAQCFTMRRVPRHSHSIVSDVRNALFLFSDFSRIAKFTVNFAVTQIRFKTIEADRCRKDLRRR